MKTRTIASLGMSGALLLGLAAGTAGINGFGAAVAGARNAEADARAANREAERARKALAKRQAAKAVTAAEAAVALAPQNGSHRALLGQAYLVAGRFTSAQQVLTEALTLEPGNGGAALNLALAQIALGEWMPARQTLETHADHIPVADRGLALALAGDPGAAVTLLTAAARAAGATPKTRQNLALSLALANRWQEAKAVAAIDVPPQQLDQRIMQWANFARPQRSSDQVASLLGVQPVADSGRPVALALNATVPQLAAAATPDPVDAYMPGPVPAPAPQSAPEAPAQANVALLASEVASATVDALSRPATASQVVFAPRSEIVQPIPAAPVRAVAAPRAPAAVGRAVAAPPRVAAPGRTAAAGNWYVQLGAFPSPAVARDAWGRLSSRVGALGSHTPSGMPATVGGQNFYRLSVGGFARSDAVRVCGEVKAKGGNCFVRAKMADTPASWTRMARR